MVLGMSFLASSLHPILMQVVGGQTHTRSSGGPHRRALPREHDPGDQPLRTSIVCPSKEGSEQSRPASGVRRPDLDRSLL